MELHYESVHINVTISSQILIKQQQLCWSVSTKYSIQGWFLFDICEHYFFPHLMMLFSPSNVLPNSCNLPEKQTHILTYLGCAMLLFPSSIWKKFKQKMPSYEDFRCPTLHKWYINLLPVLPGFQLIPLLTSWTSINGMKCRNNASMINNNISAPFCCVAYRLYCI